MKTIGKDYPRPQFVRGNFKNLNGTWKFAFDDTDEGLKKQWKDGIPDGLTIRVPFTYETELSGIGDKSVHTVVWYEKEEQFSVSGDSRVKLWFEGSDYFTTVWVNGIHIGEHTGAYTRFGFDITDALLDGKGKIVVRIYDPLTTETARGKQRWLNESFGCWYVQTTGIWKTVWSETVSLTSLESVKITPDYDDKKVDITYDLEGDLKDVEVETRISFDGKTISLDRTRVLMPEFSRTFDLQSDDCTWLTEEWSPASPNLYDVTFKVFRNGEETDNVDSYFGLRKISIDNGVIRLNNSPLYQKLVLDQGYWKESGITAPDDDALLKDVELVKAMGFNGVRKHQKIEDERFLYWCDVKGLLVWSEMGAFYRYTEKGARQFTLEWQEIVRLNYNHPSIVTWVPFNESWGIPNVASARDQQLFTENIYYLTKTYDPYRPVILNDGWEHTISDVLTLHDYDHDGENMLRRYGRDITPVLENRISHGQYKYAFADGFAYKGQPVIISEYAGVAFSDSEGWGYNEKAANADEFLNRTDELTQAVRQMPAVSGYCITQLTDVEQEVNGLLYPDRRPKADISRINAIFSK